MIDSTIRSGDKVVDGYIEQLEATVSSFNAQNSRKLIRSIDNIAKKIAKDLDLIAEEEKNPDGSEVELSGKIVDTFLKMVEKSDKIKNFSDLADSLFSSSDTVIETISTTETRTEKKVSGKNKFEEVQEKIKSKL